MKIGVCGTGRMGSAIAQRLMSVGYEIGVWNRNAAIVDGITTVRVICHSVAPSSRATLTKPSSIERAPSNVLKNTRNTTIHDVTTFEVSPIPNANTMIGARAILGIELT